MISFLLDTHILAWWLLDPGRLSKAQTDPLIQIFPITSKIAAQSVRLRDSFPRDPADQIIAATALCHNLTLITADENIRKSGRVRVV